MLVMAIKSYNGDTPVQELWGMRNTPSLPLLTVPVYDIKLTQPSRLQRGKNPNNECPSYDIKPSDGEAPVTLEL